MKKHWIMLLCGGAIVFASCTRTENTDTAATDTTTEATATAGNTAAGTTDPDSRYREHSDRIATQMSTDLQLDEEQRNRVGTTYYNRTRRYGDLQTRYSSDTTGMYADQRTIDTETDAELKSYLRPEQYTTYEQNRSSYNTFDWSQMGSTGTAGTTGGSDMEMKVKSGDTKMKVEGDESKFKSGDTKIKTEGDEAKYQSGDTKIKSEGDEAKFKSGDTKVKSEGDEFKHKSGDTKIKVERK